MPEFLDPPARPGDAAAASDVVLGIEEAAAELGLETHVLTFWEGLFPSLTPKTESGRRYYNAQDMALLRYIHTSLIDRKLSVALVRRRLKRWKGARASIRSILQQPLDDAHNCQSDETDAGSVRSQTESKTARELRSVVTDAAESGRFPSTTDAPASANLQQALERLEDVKAGLDALRARLSGPPT